MLKKQFEEYFDAQADIESNLLAKLYKTKEKIRINE